MTKTRLYEKLQARFDAVTEKHTKSADELRSHKVDAVEVKGTVSELAQQLGKKVSQIDKLQTELDKLQTRYDEVVGERAEKSDTLRKYKSDEREV